MPSAEEQIRYDVGSPIESRMDENGFLRVSGCVAKQGIYTYRTADGSIRRELVTDQVLRDDFANSGLIGAPVTLEHPREGLVNSSTAKIYSKGSAARVDFDDGKLNAELVVTDADTIKAIDEGTRQLSPGYRVVLDMTPGVFEGQAYDAVQTRRSYNHLAIVSTARGGVDCSLNLDGYAVDFEAKEEPTMATVTLPNGVTVNVDDAGTATAIQDAFTKARTDAEEMVSKERFDALQANFDELQGQMDEMKEKDEQKADSADIVAERIDSMLDVLGRARKLKPEIELRKDGVLKSEAELMTEAMDSEFEGQSEAYIKGRFDAAVELQGKTADNIKKQRSVNTDAAAPQLTAVQKAHQRFFNGGK